MNSLNYNRFPGPGDLPGDPNHPNSPDYIEPDYEEAIRAYAEGLDADDVEELIGELFASAEPILAALSGKPQDFDTVTVMQRLRAIRKSVEGAA